jgi:3-oxoisoapionate decarboxylase
MIKPTRRQMLAACAAAVPTLSATGSAIAADEKPARMGVVLYCFSIRTAADRSEGRKPGLTDPLTFLEHCHKRGAGGVQVALGTRDKEYVARLREKLEATGTYLEGILRLPEDKGDLDRFAAELRTLKEVGATVARTVLLSGRRYETFAAAEDFRKWADRSFKSLALAELVAAKHDFRLAVENHKDYRTEEQIAVLKRLDSRHVGVCFDFGNNFALLEDPLEAAEALAPWAMTTHVKDLAVAEYEDGFLLAEVPLGEGIADLKRIVATLRKARPEIRLNLEMITRDPLRVPCLTPKYWATFAELSGKHLARTLANVRKRAAKESLPKVTGASQEDRLAAEETNVRKSLAYARASLGA